MEMNYYRKVQNAYGLPLDNRQTYTKLDWILWTATLTQQRQDFVALVDPVVRFSRHARRPDDGLVLHRFGAQTRLYPRPSSVASSCRCFTTNKPGPSMPAVRRRKAPTGPLPTPPRTETLVPTSEQQRANWRYTTSRPQGNCNRVIMIDSDWREARPGSALPARRERSSGTQWEDERHLDAPRI